MTIGVLALQGDFSEHIKFLEAMEVEASEVRLSSDLERIEALIIPGGESTTMVRLMDSFGLTPKIKGMVADGIPTWGTCAGMIVLAKEVSENKPKPIGAVDISVRRNAFGRQVDSFEINVDIPILGADTFPAIFIRAPMIERIGPCVSALAYLGENEVIAAQQGNILVTAFHPELGRDQRFHSHFLRMVNEG